MTVRRAAVNAVLEALGEARVPVAAPRGLTDRELDVLRLLARGQADKELAVALGISHRTVHGGREPAKRQTRFDLGFPTSTASPDRGIQSASSGAVLGSVRQERSS